MLVDVTVQERQSRTDVIAAASRHVRAISRAAALVLALFGATVEAVLLFLCGRLRTSAQGARWIRRWCRRFLICMGVESSIEGELLRGAAVDGGGFEAIVCNHLSYLDVLLIAAALPCVMVSKDEVRRWPVVGWLTQRAGAVYVYRGGRRETYPIVNADMARAFRSGLPVVFFPEGTTTNGTEVLPFRRGLFHSVLRDEVAVRTMAIRYELVSDAEEASVDEDVCWWGDADLVPHLYRLLGLQGVRAKLSVGRTVHGKNRFDLAENARTAVVELTHRQDGDRIRMLSCGV